MIAPHSLPATLIALHVVFYAGFAGLRYWHQPFAGLEIIVFAALLVWISVVDVMQMEIPDVASFLLALTGGLFAFTSSPTFWDHFVAGVLWPFLFWGVALSYARLRGWQGLGFGDVKLMVGIGLWLGLADTALTVFAAAMAGISVIVATQLMRRQSFSEIGVTAVAFGPFLCLSAWVMWLF